VQVKGGSHCPVELTLASAPYWVLPDAGIGRTGSKAALLPSSAMGENERKSHIHFEV